MFPDGQIQNFIANNIATTMYSQINEEGHRYQIISKKIDRKTDSTAVTKDKGIETSKNGYKTMKKTTMGLWFMVQWKDKIKS